MWSQTMRITTLLALSLSLGLAEAGLMDRFSWSTSGSSNKKENPVGTTTGSSNGKDKPQQINRAEVVGTPEWSKRNRIVWGNNVYELERQAIVTNHQCEEKISFKLKIPSKLVAFKRKCKKGLETYATRYMALVMVGSPKEDQCIFTTAPDAVVYHKNNEEWKKITIIEGGNIVEEVMEKTQVEKLTAIIEKWRVANDAYLDEMKKTTQEQRQEWQRFQQAMRKIDDSIKAEFTKHQQNIVDLQNQKLNMEQHYNEQFTKEEIKAYYRPWDESVQNKLNELRQNFQAEQNVVHQKIDDENNRNMQVLQNLNNKGAFEHEKHTNKIAEMSEKARARNNSFQDKYFELLNEESGSVQ